MKVIERYERVLKDLSYLASVIKESSKGDIKLEEKLRLVGCQNALFDTRRRLLLYYHDIEDIKDMSNSETS